MKVPEKLLEMRWPAVHVLVVAGLPAAYPFTTNLVASKGPRPAFTAKRPAPNQVPFRTVTRSSHARSGTRSGQPAGRSGGRRTKDQAAEGARLGSVASLVLTPEERRLFEVLNAVARDDDTDTTLRVAGGWVRDKLLQARSAKPWLLGGLDGGCGDGDGGQGAAAGDLAFGLPENSTAAFAKARCDIDIALDDQLGTKFAQKASKRNEVVWEVGF